MSENRKFQLNLKFGEQYKETLFNIEGDSPEEFQANVAFAVDNADAIVGAAVTYGVVYNVKKPQEATQEATNPPPQRQQSWSNRGSQQQAQQQPASAPEGPAPSCRHGDMVYKPAGYSQRTKSNYNAFWSCPSRDRQDQCPTVNA